MTGQKLLLVDYCRSGEVMGSIFEVILRGEDDEHLEAVAVAVMDEIDRLDTILSRFDPRSEVSRINREAYHHPARIDRQLYELLDRCEQGRCVTEGYFDIALGIELLLDKDNCSVRLSRPEGVIDLGGVGKGYALDCGREILRRFHVTSGLMQGGTSSILAVGEEAWPIDLRHPDSPTLSPVGRIDLKDRGFSCSAARNYGHPSDIVNPLTGHPLTGSAACYVLAPSATEAEILSTALLAMGREMATEFLRRKVLPEVQVGWFESRNGLMWMIE